MKLLGLLALIAAVMALIFLGGRLLQKKWEKPQTRGDYRLRFQYDGSVEYRGKWYHAKKDLTTILVMGIDHASDAEIIGFRSGGQADFLRLFVFDDAAHIVRQLAIDRDTITDITVLGVLGDEAGKRKTQISLSHGFGDGAEQSAALTAEAVSNLLYGVTVDGCVALNLDGIPTLNDFAGGVTVTLEEDFSDLDPAMTKGSTLTLRGKQAEYYVRTRWNVGGETNEERMKRQQLYLSRLFDQLGKRIQEDSASAASMLLRLEPYMVTDMDRDQLLLLAKSAQNSDFVQTMEIPGTHKIAEDGFMQFFPDEKALEEIVLELFYDERK